MLNLEKKPEWLKAKIGCGKNYTRIRNIVNKRNLYTVCDSALCPNMGVCWENGRATLMILGDTCSRACGFCGVTSGRPGVLDKEEPWRVAEAVREMGLRDVVITSVTRDDLKDGGASIWAETILKIREVVSGVFIEILIPDFNGSISALEIVLNSKPDILGHNLETVPRLYNIIRPRADYKRSLNLLKHSHEYGLTTKTGIMLGLGETEEEVMGLMKDAVEVGCDVFFLGQYLQPTKKHYPIQRYIEVCEFDKYKKIGLDLGFRVVVSGPLIRSSYYSYEQDKYSKG